MKPARSRITLTMISLSIAIGSLVAGCVPPLTPEPTIMATSTPPSTATSSVAPTARPTGTRSAAATSTVTPTPMPMPFKLLTPRITSPQVDRNDRAALTAANGAFAFDLYHALRTKNGNLFYSPYSISLALALAYAGARGNTQQQMKDALHFTLPPERLHPAFKALDLELARRGEGNDQGFQLNIANAIWGQADYQFLPEYLDTLAQNYGVGLRPLDFAHDAEAARKTINNWVSAKTQNRINDLIPPGAIKALTRLVLTNAIYFKAAWQQQFNAHGTRDDAFHLLDGKVIAVPLMSQRDSFDYTEGDGYQAVKLPYNGGQLSTIVLLPRAGQFGAFEDSLSEARVKTIVSGMTPQVVDLTLPKFKVELSFNLDETLKQLGMPDAFSDAADFSGMSRSSLYISDVFHKAFVSVDEAGTEAAAATAVIMGGGIPSTPPPGIQFKVDRPFVFLIQDDATGTILFIGRVVNPSK